MDPVTAAAFFDELTKIAEDGVPVGRLINRDQFPTLDEGSSSEIKRPNRAADAPKTTTSSPNPEERTPAPEEQYA